MGQSIHGVFTAIATSREASPPPAAPLSLPLGQLFSDDIRPEVKRRLRVRGVVSGVPLPTPRAYNVPAHHQEPRLRLLQRLDRAPHRRGAALLLLRLGVARLLVNGVFVLAQGQARADDEVRKRRALGENYAHVVDERGVVRVVRGVHVEPARDVEVRETRERAEVREDHARGDELRGGVTRRL